MWFATPTSKNPWAVFGEGHFAADVDHRSIVGRMLEAFVDEIPVIVAALRN